MINKYKTIIQENKDEYYNIFTACMLILIGYTWAVGRPLEITMLIILTNLIVFVKKRKKIVYFITLGVSRFNYGKYTWWCNLDNICTSCN